MISQLLYLIFCFCVILECVRRKSKKSVLAPPMASGYLPIVGHAFKLLGDRKHAFNLMKSTSEEVLEKGGVMTMSVGPRVVYAISDPDDCALVSNACLEKDAYYGFAKPFLGNGLTIADVPVWKQHRKYLSPTFKQKILNGFLGVFNYQAKRLVNKLRPHLGNGPFNHETYIRLNTLESICMTAFGTDVAEFGGLHKQYLRGVNDILDILTERFQKVWLHSDFMFNMSNLKKRQDKVIEEITEFTASMLKKRKMEIKGSTKKSDKSGEFTPFMNLMLELSEETGCFTDEDIQFETNTFVGGGYDTSSSTITFALMLLGSHPEAQEKVYKELQEVFQNSDRDVDKEDLPKLVYLEAVLKETLRLYPIAPLIARYVDKDVQLKNYTLKAGHGVGLMFWAVHRHSLWGPDVEQFKPDRWLNPATLPSNPNVFTGFSLGKRGCIGKTYAMMSLKTVLSHVLRSYKITSDISKLVLEIDTILKASSGQNISIEERTILV